MFDPPKTNGFLEPENIRLVPRRNIDQQPTCDDVQTEEATSSMKAFLLGEKNHGIFRKMA